VGHVFGVYGRGGGKPSPADAQRALGIDWTDDLRELNEAIPPRYTTLLGVHLLAQLGDAALLRSHQPATGPRDGDDNEIVRAD